MLISKRCINTRIDVFIYFWWRNFSDDNASIQNIVRCRDSTSYKDSFCTIRGQRNMSTFPKRYTCHTHTPSPRLSGNLYALAEHSFFLSSRPSKCGLKVLLREKQSEIPATSLSKWMDTKTSITCTEAC